MQTIGDKAIKGNTGLSRRDFLRIGGLGALGLTVTERSLASSSLDDRAVIFLMLVGGPSQIDTFDPKPDAPDEIRGPFRSIATELPGVRVVEHLPRLARRMRRLTLIRSLHHDAAPIHETGLQLLQTGHLSRPERDWPHFGSVARGLLGARQGASPFVVLPGPIGPTGVCISNGQSAGFLGGQLDPALPVEDALAIDREPASIRDAYGTTRFGRSCLRARQLVEAGSRVVVVNMFPTVFNEVSWDCHGSAPFSSLDDYKSTVLPMFDQAFSALIDDLDRCGRLDSTLVVASGEFGRTPRRNPAGGRDHWPGVWSAVVAGGGTPGGQIVGASDSRGAEPADRPVSPPELLATIYRSLRLDPTLRVQTPEGETVTLVDGPGPISELLA